MNNYRRARPLLGTIVEISVWHDSEISAQTAITAAFTQIESVQMALSIHNTRSEVSGLNALPARTTAKINFITSRAFKIAEIIFRMSGGLFDVVFPKHKNSKPSFKDINILPNGEVSFTCDLRL